MQSNKSTQHDQVCNCNPHGGRYYAELARISAWLFIGVLALMTFLLTVGLQHPQKMFSTFFYFSIVLLPLNLIIYVISHMMAERVHAQHSGGWAAVEAKPKAEKSGSDDEDDSDDNGKESVGSDAPKAKSAKSAGLLSWVRALRMVQQLLFIVSLLAVTGLALVSAHIFFAPPTAAPQTQQGQ